MNRHIQTALRVFLVLTAVATAAIASDDEAPVHGLPVPDLAHADVTQEHGIPAELPNSVEQQAGPSKAPADQLITDETPVFDPSPAAPTGPCNESTCCFSHTANPPANPTTQRPSEQSELPALLAYGPSTCEEVPCHQPLSPEQPLASGFTWMRLGWHRLWRHWSDLVAPSRAWVQRQLAQLRQHPLELLALPAVSPLPAMMVHRGPRMASGEEWAPGGAKGAQVGTEAAGQGSEQAADVISAAGPDDAGVQGQGLDMDAVEGAVGDEEVVATVEAKAAELADTAEASGVEASQAGMMQLPGGAEEPSSHAPSPQDWQLQEQMAADMAGMWDDGEDLLLGQQRQPTDPGQDQLQQSGPDPLVQPHLTDPGQQQPEQLGSNPEEQQLLQLVEAMGSVAYVPEGNLAAPQHAPVGHVQPPLPQPQPRPYVEAQSEAPTHAQAAPGSRPESEPVAASQGQTQEARQESGPWSGHVSQQPPLPQPQPRPEVASGQGPGSEPGSGDVSPGWEAASADLQGSRAGAPPQGRVAGDVLSELQAAGTPRDVAEAIDSLLAAGGADALLGAGGWEAGWLDAGRAPGLPAQLQPAESAPPVGYGALQAGDDSAATEKRATVGVETPAAHGSAGFRSQSEQEPPRRSDPGSANAEKVGARNEVAAHGSACAVGESPGYAAKLWVAVAVLQLAAVAGWVHSWVRLRAASKQLRNRDEAVRQLQERLAVEEQAAVQLRCEQDAAEARGADLAAQLDKALAEAGKERAGRAAAVAAAARLRQLHAAAMLQLAERVPELQRGQEALGRGLAEACQGWRAAGERMAEGLAAARGLLSRMAARAAEERRRATASLQAAKVAHAAEVEQLKEQHREELQRQREAADARSSALRGLLREAAGQLGELRARHRRNVEAWLVLRADTAVQLTAVQEQAGRLAAEHRAQAASARDRLAVQQGLLDHMGQQLQHKVVAVVAAQRYNSELEELLSQKDDVILEHIRELAATRAALDAQRSQCGVLQRTLQEGEEALAAAREEAGELRQRLGDTQASMASSEARCTELTAANELLDAQVAEFTESAALLAQLQERFVGPAQRREAALEAALAEAREGAARAVAERDERLRALGEELAGAHRDLEATQRQMQEARAQLEKRERELQALQAEIAELSRREDEGVENSLAAVRQWEHDTAAQLLLPLPADVKGGPLALLAGHGGIGSGGGGLGTPGSTGGYGGGLGTPGAGGGMVGSSGGSSTSGVRGAGSFSFGSFRK